MSAEVEAWADQLRQYATHFAFRDWDYTRDIGDLRKIRYRRDWTGYNNPLRRVIRWLSCYFIIRPESFLDVEGRRLAWRHPIIHARVSLRTERNLPDGVLDAGGIITVWEETGEYLQYVQPTVGAMLADWMDADPESPHAQRIATEMKRINDRYSDRIAATSEPTS